MVRYTANGVSVPMVAALMGVSISYVEDELAYERIRARGDALDRAMLDLIGNMRKALRGKAGGRRKRKPADS